MRTRKAATVAVVLTALLAACGDDGDPDSTDGGRAEVTVAALPLTDSAALYIAEERGLFEKEGLDVRVEPVQQSIQALPALAKGQVDVISSANYVTFLQAHEQGTLDVRIVAEGVRVAPHMMDVLVAEDSGIERPAGLAGKKVAVNILNNIQSLTLNAILDDRGIDRPVYRQIAFPQMGAALEKGEVDAVHAVEPFDSGLQKDLRARVVLDGGAAPVESLPISGYVTTRQYTEQHPRTAAAFRRAIEAASKIAARDPSSVRTQLPTYAQVSAAQARSIGLPAYPAGADASQLRRLTALMVEQELLEQPIDPAKLLVK